MRNLMLSCRCSQVTRTPRPFARGFAPASSVPRLCAHTRDPFESCFCAGHDIADERRQEQPAGCAACCMR